jgi:cell division protein FtsB
MMEQNEVTIKQIADQCGVSKSTAVRKFKEMDLPVITRGGKGTVYLGPEAASALAHALIKARVPEVPDERVPDIADIPREQPQPVIASGAVASVQPTGDTYVSGATDAMVDMYREQIRSLSRTNDLLRDQINQLNIVLEMMKTQHDSTIAVLSDQIDHLNAQIATLQKEKDKMRDELAMSRALEGFHFPWQRDRIVSRYLLPATPEETSDEPTYEE